MPQFEIVRRSVVEVDDPYITVDELRRVLLDEDQDGLNNTLAFQRGGEVLFAVCTVVVTNELAIKKL
jgi:hypothetical protein